MTGTAREVADELWAIYQLPTVTLPENRPCPRAVYPAKTFPDSKTKWLAIVEESPRFTGKDGRSW